MGDERRPAGARGGGVVHGGGRGGRPAGVGMVAAGRGGAGGADPHPGAGTFAGRCRARTGRGGSDADAGVAHFPGRTGPPRPRRRVRRRGRWVRCRSADAAGGVVPVAVRLLPGGPGRAAGVRDHRHRGRHGHRGAGGDRQRRGVDRHRGGERPGRCVRVDAGRVGPRQRPGGVPAGAAPGDPRPGGRGVAGGPPPRRGGWPVRPAGLPGAAGRARRRRAAARVVRGPADRPVQGHRVGRANSAAAPRPRPRWRCSGCPRCAGSCRRAACRSPGGSRRAGWPR